MHTPNFQSDTEDKVIQVMRYKNTLSEEKIADALLQASHVKQTLFQYLLQYRCVSPDDFLQAFVGYTQLSVVSLHHKKHEDFPMQLVPLSYFNHHLILPIEKTSSALVIAIANPNDMTLQKMLSFKVGVPIEFVAARYDTLCRFHNAIISRDIYLKNNNENHDSQLVAHQILSDAIHQHASDIHIEPHAHYLKIRFRIDGLLHDIIKLSTGFSNGIINCLKVLANVDIAVKRMPQDGRMNFRSNLGFYKDCRMSSCPTIHGEKLVIRLLDANTSIRLIHELGLQKSDQERILHTIKQPQGLILVTGPTGSGKTITLYTLLSLLNQPQRNINTIEDPVEMQIENLNQTPINTKSGLTFSYVLRALLRQDPDVIMIGEIRDPETADMAMRAAQTGHLVLSTLHTNNAAEAITRLTHMGVAPFHLSAALTLVIAQRLVRRLCVYCKKPVACQDSLLNEKFTDPPSFTESECTQCVDGFHGRLGIFELMPITASIKKLIFEQESTSALTKQNILSGQMSLWDAGIHAVKNGWTSLSEIQRLIPEKT